MSTHRQVHNFLRWSLRYKITVVVFIADDRSGVADVQIAFIESETKRLRQSSRARLNKRGGRGARRCRGAQERSVNFGIYGAACSGKSRSGAARGTTRPTGARWSAGTWTGSTARRARIDAAFLEFAVVISVAKHR